jgi:hypothetical protein
MPFAEQPDVAGQRHPRLFQVRRRLFQGEGQVAEQVGEHPGGGGVAAAGARRHVPHRLGPGERRHLDRPGEPPPRSVERGDHHVAVPGGGQERLDQLRIVGVVEHEQPTRCPVEFVPQRGPRVLVPLPAPYAYSGGQIGQAGRHPGPVVRDHPPGDPPRRPAAVRQLDRDLRLAHARQPDQRHRRRMGLIVVEGLVEHGQQLFPAGEAGVARRQVHGRLGGRGFRGQRRRLMQHGGVHAAQRRGRVDAELVGERAAAPLVGGQRVRLPAGGVQGADQAQRDRLAERVGGGQLLEQRQRVRRPVLPGVHVGDGLDRLSA